MVGLVQEHTSHPAPHSQFVIWVASRLCHKWQNYYTPPLKTPCIRDQRAIIQLSSRVLLLVRWVWWQYTSTASPYVHLGQRGFVVNWQLVNMYVICPPLKKPVSTVHCTALLHDPSSGYLLLCLLFYPVSPSRLLGAELAAQLIICP